MNARHHICLVTPGHLVSTPRLCKEADSLVRAGYRVTVVSRVYYPPNEPLDAALIQNARWTSVRVPTPQNIAWLCARLRRSAARLACKAGIPLGPDGLADALRPEWRVLAKAAATVRADLYIGHCLGGLAAAARAASTRGTRLGFDVEDLHEAETDHVLEDPVEQAATRGLLGRWIPHCRHLTASSPEIATVIRERYGNDPSVVLNVFPSSEAPTISSIETRSDPDRPLRCYWFSQTIGPGRGLEAAVRVLGRLDRPVELHLRGFPQPGYIDTLEKLARETPRPCRVVVLPPAVPAEMARLASGADLGLSLEESQPPNRDLCLTNKLFTYLLAGIPQWLSPTTAQSSLAPALGEAVLLADPARPQAAADILSSFFRNPEQVTRARNEARRLALGRYCWDHEQQIFLESVRRALQP